MGDDTVVNAKGDKEKAEKLREFVKEDLPNYEEEFLG